MGFNFVSPLGFNVIECLLNCGHVEKVKRLKKVEEDDGCIEHCRL